MDGRPVWLASCSLRRNDRLVATGRYSQQQRYRAMLRCSELLAEVGDLARVRLFRMNITVCLHKALTDAEVEALVPSWSCGRGRDIAGGPVEVLWETVPGAESTRPCHAPARQIIAPARPDLWLPLDCGKCPPCLARASL